ncbi:LytTR family DNA-binding domain-containing protein [uncultured Bacteroides sp.]|uniref:LytR/AlgR family response regulator transcription factor n=1 Tax=uncultured Bacteroides sp. TaxID=162156 RepID=UPI002AAB454B|nr:LytTR family DNA-binding domain-containing protein [uncultured Bacteroides sp.]
MNCIVVDDEPLAREGIGLLVKKIKGLNLVASVNSADAAAKFILSEPIDLVFLDIQMPGTNGIDFAKTIPQDTLVIFTTAYSEYALNSYEVDAIDYLLKPITLSRFQKAVDKAFSYHDMLQSKVNSHIESVETDFIFVKSERRIFKIYFKDIRYIEGLKDYVVIYTQDAKIITAINLKNIYEQLPQNIFIRVSKSYIVNLSHIDSLDNNDIQIGTQKIPIGNSFREYLFDKFISKKILSNK